MSVLSSEEPEYTHRLSTVVGVGSKEPFENTDFCQVLVCGVSKVRLADALRSPQTHILRIKRLLLYSYILKI